MSVRKNMFVPEQSLQDPPYRIIKKHFSYQEDNSKISKQWISLNKKCDVIDSYLKHTLRPYQRKALMYYMYAQHHYPEHYRYLFDMATGSGKTDIMAAIIIYMYLYVHINKFLYTVVPSAIVSQIKNNFINPSANKFLYTGNPVTGENCNHAINIQQVSDFPHVGFNDTIYIIMVTTDKLHSDWKYPKENGISKSDLYDQKIVILGDEAHHFNSATKNGLTKKQKEENSTLEGTLLGIQGACNYCMQLGFTATPNQNHNKAVAKKYSSEIIYDYDLSKFMNQRYSKNVYDIKSHSDNPIFKPNNIQNPQNISVDDIRRMISAVLMSQARKIEANKLNISGYKPIVLFKAKYKSPGKYNHTTTAQYTRLFNSIISHLDVNFLKSFIKAQLQSLTIDHKLHKIPYTVYDKFNNFSNTQLQSLVTHIKKEFAPAYVINVNDGKDHREQLNSLEINNIRAIFEINKLNEGWDVLNLFDIVRLDDTTISETNQEAQLIGRGARYYSFDYHKRAKLQQKQRMNVNKYKRCFDSSDDPMERLLEALYYHTTNDNKYIKELQKKFVENNVVLSVDSNPKKNEHAHINKQFKETDWYKNRCVYANLCYEPDLKRNYRPEDIGLPTWDSTNSLEPYCSCVRTRIDDRITSGKINESENDEQIDNEQNYHHDYHLSYNNVLKRVMEEKVMENNSFYHFDNLIKYLPNLKSPQDFVKNWLVRIRCKVYTTDRNFNVDIKDHLDANYAIIKDLMGSIESLIKHLYNRPPETLYMYPIPIKTIVGNYQKTIPTKALGQSKKTGDGKKNANKMNDSWFIYDTAINDSELEKTFIKKVGSRLAKQYDNGKNQFYMIRNEGPKETNIFLNTHFVTYMPDYILLFNINGRLYEFYAEPKDPNYLDPNNYNYDNTIAKDKLLSFIEPQDPKMKIVRSNLASKTQKYVNLPYFDKGDKENSSDLYLLYPNGYPYQIKTINDNGKDVPLLYGLRFFTHNDDSDIRQWLHHTRDFKDLPNNFMSAFKSSTGYNKPFAIDLLNLK